MHYRSIAAIIAATYSILVGAWLATLPAAQRAFSRQPEFAEPEGVQEISGCGARPITSAGALLVFLANIATMGLLLGSVLSPGLAARLPRLRFALPRVLNLIGAGLFVANGIWGTLVLIFNPSYTPFFIHPAGPARLATRGPYALVRHPRYAAEASLNIILAAFTGMWLPLVGILGWPALRRQARFEEAHLLRVAPVAYAAYLERTGSWLPSIARMHRRGARLSRARPTCVRSRIEVDSVRGTLVGHHIQAVILTCAPHFVPRK